jgi:hypothetical protein
VVWFEPLQQHAQVLQARTVEVSLFEPRSGKYEQQAQEVQLRVRKVMFF